MHPSIKYFLINTAKRQTTWLAEYKEIEAGIITYKELTIYGVFSNYNINQVIICQKSIKNFGKIRQFLVKNQYFCNLVFLLRHDLC